MIKSDLTSIFAKSKNCILVSTFFLIQTALQAQIFPQGIPNLPIEIPANIQIPNGLGGSRIQSGSNRIEDQPRKQILDPLEKAKLDSSQRANEIELRINREKSDFLSKIYGYSIFHNSKNAFDPSLKIATPRNYILGADDELLIEISGVSVFQEKKSVTPDGFIRMGGTIGNIYVAGKTIEQAKTILSGKLSENYSSLSSGGSVLSVTLGNVRTIRVQVLGEVSKPGTYPVSSFATISNGLYQAGGLNENGSFREIKLVRNNKVVGTLDIYEILTFGASKNDISLRDQDVIQVGNYTTRVSLEGKIKKSGLYEMLPNETVKDLINYAGGFSNGSFTKKIKLVRITDKQKKIIEINNEDFSTFKLQDGDRMIVDPILDKFENQVNITGSVYRPGAFSLEQNPTLSELVKSAELKEDAFTGRVSVVRLRADLSRENISVNLGDILLKKAQDVTLQKDDEININSKIGIREKYYVRVQGAVNLDLKPKENETGYFDFIENESVEDLILRAGGLKSTASTSRVEVFRQKLPTNEDDVNNKMNFEQFSFSIARDLNVGPNATTFILKPYDQLFVRYSPNHEKNQVVLVEGQVVYEGEFPLMSKDQRVSDIIKQCGGLNNQAYVKGATLLRKIKLTPDEIRERAKTISEQSDNEYKTRDKEIIKSADVSPDRQETIDINLEDAIGNPGSASDLILQDGDVIRVPKLLQVVRIQGEVLYPRLAVYQGNNLKDYISASGGYTTLAKPKSIWVRYANGTVARTKKVLFFKSYPTIEPGSEIFVVGKTKNDITFQQIARDFATIVSVLAGFAQFVTSIILIQKL